MCCLSQLSPLRETEGVFGSGVNFQGHHRSGEDTWKLTQLQSKVLVWLFTCLVCSSLTLPAYIWSELQIPNCALQAVFPPDLHATMIKICCLIPDLYNEPEIFYHTLNFWLTWYEAMQWDTHTRTHTPEQRFETAAAFLSAQGRGTLVSWTGGLPDKQQVTLLLTTTF